MNTSQSSEGRAASRAPSLAAGALAGVAIAATEFVPLVEKWDELPIEAVGAGSFLLAALAIPTVVLGLHALVALAAHRAVERVAPRFLTPFWLLVAAGFGAAWQDSVMHGDGIRALAHYEVIRVVGFAVGAAGMAALAWILGWAQKIPLLARRGLAAVLVLGSVLALHVIFPAYKPFHGYLAMFAAALLLWLLAPALRGRAVAAIAWGTLIVATVATMVVPGARERQAYAQLLSHVPQALLSLPTTSWAKIPPESLLVSKAGITDFEAEFAANRAKKPVARGRNVLFIVLESTRADAWADPELTPEFHDWRKNGLYFPEAVSQYPATPLAYGAMFTSQPPTILTQTPNWARSRLFDDLAPRFDHLVMSKPRNEWFETSVITDFFVPRDAEVKKHPNARTGLLNLRTQLQTIDPAESFFAWIHLYEPHQPWHPRRKYLEEDAPKKPPRADAYRSEVALVDDYLGDFMRWFQKQPFADETLVVMFSDHGEGLGERIDGKRYWGHHVHVRNVVSHVPAYFAGPGIPRGVMESGYTVQQLDVMPTMFDFLGLPLPADAFAQGRSVYDLIEEKPQRPLVTEALSMRGKEFFEFVGLVQDGELDQARALLDKVTRDPAYPPKLGLQFGRHKLVRDMLLRRSRVYDIETDPDETKNIAEKDPAARDLVMDEFERWRARQVWVLQQLEK